VPDHSTCGSEGRNCWRLSEGYRNHAGEKIMTTFAQQARRFLTEGECRAKKPFRPNTIKNYKSQIETVINPLIGDKPMEDVGNKLLKEVCLELQEQDYSAKSINDILMIIKQIVKSAVDENGDFLYPREWNSKFIDAPAIENQKQPTVDAKTLLEAISKAIPGDKALYALLAGTGLRINEALGIGVFDDGKSNFMAGGIVHVRSQRDGDAPKTKAGVRQVDLTPELEIFVRANIQPKDNLMFPDSESSYRERMERNGILGGFHAFRRFRIDQMDATSTPEGLQRFWAGHAAKDVHQTYIKKAEKIEERKLWVEKTGLGFKLEAQ
jgi:integrase